VPTRLASASTPSTGEGRRRSLGAETRSCWQAMPVDASAAPPPAARTPAPASAPASAPALPVGALGGQDAESSSTSRHLPEVQSPSASSQSKSILEGTPQAGLTSLFGITPVQRGRVWFNSPANSAVDITPYSRIYGVHPRFFDFDAVGEMQLTPAAAKACRAWKGNTATTAAAGGSPQANAWQQPEAVAPAIDTPRNKVAGNTTAPEQADAEGLGWPTCSRRATMTGAADSRSLRSCSPPPFPLGGNSGNGSAPAVNPPGTSSPPAPSPAPSGPAPPGPAVSGSPAGSTSSGPQLGSGDIERTSRAAAAVIAFDGNIEGSSGDSFIAKTARSPRQLGCSARTWSPPPGRAERGGSAGRGSTGRLSERSPRQNFSLAAHSRAQLGGDSTALFVDRAATNASQAAFSSRVGEAPGLSNGTHSTGATVLGRVGEAPGHPGGAGSVGAALSGWASEAPGHSSGASSVSVPGRVSEAPRHSNGASTKGSQQRSLSASCADRAASLLRGERAASLLSGAMKELNGSSSVSQLDLLRALNRALDNAVGASGVCQATGPTCGISLKTLESVAHIAKMRPAVGQTCSTAWSAEESKAAPIRQATGQSSSGTEINTASSAVRDQLQLSARRTAAQTSEALCEPPHEARVPVTRDRILTAALPEAPATQMVAAPRQSSGNALLVVPPRRTPSMPHQVRVSWPPASLQTGNGVACRQTSNSGTCSPSTAGAGTPNLLLPTNLAQVPLRSACASKNKGTSSPPAPQPLLRSRHGGA